MRALSSDPILGNPEHARLYDILFDMDDLVLILRNGAAQAERGAPLALLQDSVSCVGGPAALRQACAPLQLFWLFHKPLVPLC